LKIATTAFVATGLSEKVNKAYVDNLLTAKAPLASPTFTGSPTLPTGTIATTQTSGDNSTKLATTAFVSTAVTAKADLASPTFTGTVAAPTPTAGDNSTKVATTAFVTSAMEATTVDIGAAGTSAGNGVRIGNARLTVNKPTAPSSSSSGSSQTLTVTQVLDAGIYIFAPSASGKSLTFPTAANLVAALPNATVGDTFTMLIINDSGSNSFTLSAGSGITIVPSSTTLNTRTSKVVYFRITNATSSSEAISIYY
jgi:hypothetical protein